MENEKAKKKAPAAPKKKENKGGLKEYFKGIKLEMKKVVWPTKKQLLNHTLVVIAALIIVGLIIFGLDSLFITLSTLVTGK